jgi:uncharacterized cupin superfamily protein
MSSADESEKPIRKPIASESVAWEEWSHGERFGSRFRHLTTAAVGGNDYHVGVQIEELPPGKQTCPLHWHVLEEEHVMVLDGRVTLRLGEERIEMRTGDYVVFPAKQAAGHCFVNEGDAVVRLLVIGERKGDEVCVYPDSNKVLVRALGQVFDRAAVKEYWDCE